MKGMTHKISLFFALLLLAVQPFFSMVSNSGDPYSSMRIPIIDLVDEIYAFGIIFQVFTLISLLAWYIAFRVFLKSSGRIKIVAFLIVILSIWNAWQSQNILSDLLVERSIKWVDPMPLPQSITPHNPTL